MPTYCHMTASRNSTCAAADPSTQGTFGKLNKPGSHVTSYEDVPKTFHDAESTLQNGHHSLTKSDGAALQQLVQYPNIEEDDSSNSLHERHRAVARGKPIHFLKGGSVR